MHFMSANQYLFDAQDARQSGPASFLHNLPATIPEFERVGDPPVMTCDVYAVHHRGPNDEELDEEVQCVK